MRKMDQRGQISIEFTLIIAFMLVLVLLIASYAGNENESYVILSAARDGAVNATTNLVLLNGSVNPLKVENIFTNGSGQDITIQINISSSLSDGQIQNITNSTLSSIAAQGYTRVNSTNPESNASNDYIVTSRHTYYVQIV